jgi:catechol 2,3-dioxygenase-like lactoylglutathione lyase family enzyme
MHATLNHIQINVSNKSVSYPFYKDMLTMLGYTVIADEEWGFGMKDPKSELVIWVAEIEEKHKDKNYHRKAAGLNHLAFKVDSKDEVDQFYKEFVEKRGVKPLYDTPKLFPEYTPDYYAVFFEDPDRVKLEVVTM